MPVHPLIKRCIHFFTQTWIGRILIFLAVAVVVGSHTVTNGHVHYPIDLDVYREGGRAFIHGQDLYAQTFEVSGISLPFTYPPLAAIIFSVLALAPLPAMTILMIILTGAVSWWCGYIVIRRLSSVSPSSAFWGAGLLMPLTLLTEPFSQTISFGQINVFLMALVLLDIAVARPRWPRGIFIGLAAAIKLTPAVFGLYFLVKKDWKSAIVCLASGVVWSGIAWLILPTDSHEYWTVEIKNPDRIGGLSYARNQSVRGTLARLIPGDGQAQVWMIVGVVIVALVIAAMMRVARAERLAVPEAHTGTPSMALMSLNSLLALLVSPVSWSHHWVWFLPFLLVIFYFAWNSKSITLWILGLVGLALCTVLPFHWFFPSRDGAEIHWSWWEQILGSDYVVWGLAMLVIAAIIPGAFATRPAGVTESTGAERVSL